MKRTFKYIAVLSLTLLLSSCGNDWLDLQKDDSFSAKPEDLTTKNIISMQIGMYDAIQSPADPDGKYIGNIYYGAKMIYDGDVRGDDFQYVEGSSSRADDSYLYSYALNNAEGCWEPAYYLIKTANAIIAVNPKDAATGDNQVQIDNIKGQAYMLRALAHFDILRNYGEFYDIDSKWGIPIINRVIPGGELDTNKPKRNTVREVYEQIIKDLKGTTEAPGAITLMANGKNTPGFVNQWSAKALLCRTYLYMGENEECLKVANEIIKSSPYALWGNDAYVNSWAKVGHSEALFEIINNTDDNLGREGIGYLMYPATGSLGYGDIVATLQYANLFEDGDVRKKLFFADKLAKEGSILYGKNVFVYKYPGTLKSPSGEGNNNMTTSIQVLRLSEVYLNAAEAAQKMGDAQADALLTTIVQRANPSAPAVSGANLERVLLERRKELGGEGFRFYDALRNNKTMYRDNVKAYMDEVNASGVTVVVPEGVQTMNEKLHPVLSREHLEINRNHKKVIYPIPAREINIINIHSEILEQYYKW